MGQAKLKQRAAFQPRLIESWEADACVNFAVALARLTGWLLHVDWWVPTTSPDQDVPFDLFRPLRVYVADNHDRVFDVRGVRSILDFNERTIKPLALSFGSGGVRTRFYSEEKLFELPLQSKPEESQVTVATVAIQTNHLYLAAVPTRSKPSLPAYEAARFMFGQCVPFAEALKQRTGLQTAAILVKRFHPQYEATHRSSTGFIHSVLLHQDGTAEDSWGRANLKDIAARFGAVEFSVSPDEHDVVVATLKRNSQEKYQAAMEDAAILIEQYRLAS